MAELEPGRARALVSAAAAVAELSTGDLTSAPSPHPLHLPSQSNRAPPDRGFWIHAALELGRRHGALLLHIHAKGDDERGGSHRFLPALSPGRPPPSMELRPMTSSSVKGVRGHPSLCGDGGTRCTSPTRSSCLPLDPFWTMGISVLLQRCILRVMIAVNGLTRGMVFLASILWPATSEPCHPSRCHFTRPGPSLL